MTSSTESFRALPARDQADSGAAPAADDNPLTERLAADMVRRWQAGERPLAEEYLNCHPELWQQPEAAVDLIYEELCLRRKHGAEVPDADLLQRFPQWRSELEILLRCHEALEGGLEAPQFPRTGEVLGDVVLQAELSRGRRSRVYLATQPSVGNRSLVLKLTLRDGREHVALGSLQHSHIVPLYGVQDDPTRNLRALCMPYFGGTSLAQLLELLASHPAEMRHGRDLLEALARSGVGATTFPPSAARAYLERASYPRALCWLGACLADALDYAHERGLVHLDVKPSNVLLAADGQPMLLDFHLARPPLAPGSSVGEWLGGTLPYMSPEQRQAVEAIRQGRPIPAPVDGRSDVYSLGLLLYESLGGPVPRPATHPPRLETLNRQVSAGLSDLIDRCLRPAAAERYPNARALAADLRRHLEDRPLQGVANRSWLERWAKWRRRSPHGLRLMNLALAFVLIAGAFGIFLAFSVAGRLSEGRGWLERGRKARLAGQPLAATEALQHGLVATTGQPLAGELRKDLEEEMRWAVDQQLDDSRRLLEQAKRQRQRRQGRDALATLRQGLAALPNLAACAGLRRQYHEELLRAGQVEAAGRLHHFVDRLRFLQAEGDRPLTGARAGLIKACALFWDKSRGLADSGDPEVDALLGEQVREDLLDLAVLWADLRTQGTPGDPAAVRAALDVLAQAEKRFGPSRALCQQRRRHAEALGLDALAQEAARQADGLTPRTAWEHYAVGRGLLQEGKLDPASAAFRRATDLRPGALWPYFYQGICDYRRGRHADAAGAFSVAVALSNGNARCYNNRGLALARLGESARALRDFDEALQREPGLAQAALNRGLLHLHEKRYDKAEADLRLALARGAPAAVAHFHLARVHQARGDRQATLASLREVLEHEPHHLEARQLLQQLQLRPWW